MRPSHLPLPLRLPPALLLSVLLQTAAPPLVLALDNDFSAYPSGSQQCLYDAADTSRCTGDTGQELNACLCTNQGNFIYDTADCVARESPSDLNSVYSTLENNCAGTGITIAVPKDAFLASAEAATASTSSPTPSATSSSTTTTSSPTASDTASPSASATTDALSTGAKIGIGVGVGFGAIALALLAWFVWAYSRRRRSANPGTALASHDPGSPPLEYGMTTRPPMTGPEYAQQNTQASAAELAPAEWKPPGAYYGAKHEDDDADGRYKNASGVPLLAELGSDQQLGAPAAPVELPADGFLHQHQARGYDEHGGAGGAGYAPGQARHSVVTPQEGLSPAGLSGSGRGGDVSPFSSRNSRDYRTE